MNEARKEAVVKLRECGLQVSEPRIAIYLFLQENRIHPTADTIYKALAADYPALSKTTVYNTLKLFASKNLISTVTIEDGELRFDGDTSFHGHFKCTCCGNVYDVFGIDRNIQTQTPAGFISRHCHVLHYGLCGKCAAAQP